MKSKFSGIYKITNKENGKIYIGQAKNIYLRWLEHKCRLRNNYNECEYLQRAWNKYRENSFKFEVIEKCDIENLSLREFYWANFYQTFNRVKGYNIRLIDKNGKNVVSEETKLKISNFNKNRIFSKERNKKISNSKKGISRDKETKEKLSLFWKNQYQNKNYINPMQGKKHSLETKEKIRIKAEGRIRESRKKLLIYDESNNFIAEMSLKDGLKTYGTHIYYCFKNNKLFNGNYFKIL